jgi:hypothetical protein
MHRFVLLPVTDRQFPELVRECAPSSSGNARGAANHREISAARHCIDVDADWHIDCIELGYRRNAYALPVLALAAIPPAVAPNVGSVFFLLLPCLRSVTDDATQRPAGQPGDNAVAHNSRGVD